MAVKIASAMGADVTAISRSLSKRADAQRMGAKYYLATSDLEAVELVLPAKTCQ
jgi:uncharacterized zinc-type alcohol dehydrogenase-like protein